MAKNKLKLEKYTSDREQFVSIFRGIPIKHLETVRSTVKQAASRVEELVNSGTKLEVRVRFRGPRYSNPLHTLKWDAEAFDVYVNTQNLPRRLSAKQRREIAEQNRAEVVDMIRYSSENLSF